MELSFKMFLSLKSKYANRLNLRARLILIASGVIFALGVIILGGWWGMSALNSAREQELQIERTVTKFQKIIRGLNELVITEGSGTSKQFIKASVKEADEYLNSLSTDDASNIYVAKIKELVLPNYREALNNIEILLQFSEGEITASSDNPIRLFARSVKNIEKAIGELSKIHAQVSEEGKAKVDSIILIMLTGVGFSVATIIVLFFLLYRNIVVPIFVMAHFAKNVSSGNFSVALNLNRSDEIGVLAEALRQMSESLRKTLFNIKESSDQLYKKVNQAAILVSESEKEVRKTLIEHKNEATRADMASNRLRELSREVTHQCELLKALAGESTSAVDHIAQSNIKVAEKSSSHLILAENTAINVKNIFNSLSDISESMQYLTAATEELAAATSQMQATVSSVEQHASQSQKAASAVYIEASSKTINAVKSAETSIDVIQNAMSSLAESVLMLESRSQQIGAISGLINNVAEQTSLLALNAAILAAQAGKHGLGFAVVASEVKTLAQSTLQSTNEISSLIQTIQDETTASALMAKTGMASVTEGVKRFKEVRDSLDTMRNLSKESKEKSEFIGEAMKEQTLMAQQILQTIIVISSKVEAVSTSTYNLDNSGKSILLAMEDVKIKSEEMNQIIHNQLDESQLILHASENISRNTGEILMHMHEVEASSGEIGAIVDVLHSGTENLGQKITGLSGIVRDFEEQSATVLKELGKFSV